MRIFSKKTQFIVWANWASLLRISTDASECIHMYLFPIKVLWSWKWPRLNCKIRPFPSYLITCSGTQAGMVLHISDCLPADGFSKYHGAQSVRQLLKHYSWSVSSFVILQPPITSLYVLGYQLIRNDFSSGPGLHTRCVINCLPE